SPTSQLKLLLTARPVLKLSLGKTLQNWCSLIGQVWMTTKLRSLRVIPAAVFSAALSHRTIGEMPSNDVRAISNYTPVRQCWTAQETPFWVTSTSFSEQLR